jgi:hypothetical protein
MTESSAKDLITYAKTLFGEADTTSVVGGDLNGSGTVNISDINYMVDYFFRGGAAPVDINQGDVNGDCAITISDLSYLVDYLFRGGVAPLPGCVE